METKRKGQFSLLQGAAISLGIIVITLGVVIAILTGITNTLTAGSVAQGAVNNGTNALIVLVNWLPTIVLVVAAVVVLGFVFMLGRGKQ